jgi:GT2 family glycosyltransferase
MHDFKRNVINALSRFSDKYNDKGKKSKSKKLTKIVSLPDSFLTIFDAESYLIANPDVRQSIKDGRHSNALEHFKVAGYEEVQQGGRRIGAKFPHFNAEVYLKYNADLAQLNTPDKAFEHFVAHGYGEYLQSKRIVVGYYPLLTSSGDKQRLKETFNEEAYLLANNDVVEAIEAGDIKSGWDHFIKYGIFEAQTIGRPLDVIVGSMTEPEYLFKFPDLFKPFMQGVISSPFEHYLRHGLAEIVSGKRVVHAYGGYHYHEPKVPESLYSDLSELAYKPTISIIIPVYNVDKKWLELAISSVESQWYTNWEICIADDASTKLETINYLKSIQSDKIKVEFLKDNVNISGASNAALSLATGDYIALMDNDDEITPDALYETVLRINEGAEFIYSDEDKLELNGQFSDPHFKPDFSPDMFLSHNYLSHLGVIKRSLVVDVGGWTLGLEGAQDYDLYLKVLERTTKVSHIPKVLYHWRKVPGSTAAAFSEKSYAQLAGKKALANALDRRGIEGEVEYGVSPGLYRIKYGIVGNPLVSIVIPFKDMPELLTVCVTAILEKTTYSNFEIIGVSNNSVEPATFEEMNRLSTLDERVHFSEYNVPFNYSKINNYGVNQLAKGDVIVFMNNDIEVISEHWLEEMLMLAQREGTGCVGAKLLYENSSIQHAGIVLAPGSRHLVIPVFSGFPRNALGYAARIATVNNYSAVTAALLMVSKEKFSEAGGFDEVNFAVAYNDVDLCLKIKRNGYDNVYTPFAEAFHYESMSRGYDTESVSKLERMSAEAGRLKTIDEDFFRDYDSSYNPNLNINDVSFRISPEVGRLNEPFVGKPFTEEIVRQGEWCEKKHNRVCLFSHFDQDDIIDEYVIQYLKEISALYDVVFITTSSSLSDTELKKIQSYCMRYVIKENYGYDFGAWKSGLNNLSDLLLSYDYLLMCNDSVYGPFHNLEQIVSDMESLDFDVWSMTDSLEYNYHLQSYFIQYSTKAFTSALFTENWNNFKIFEDKSTLIQTYEVGYSSTLADNKELKTGAYYSVLGKTNLNTLQYYWDEMIDDGFPFLKIEVVKKNPLNINISGYSENISKVSNYNTELISKHILRVK